MKTRIFCIAALAAAIAACSSTPPANSALDQAAIDFKAVQENPQVITLASDELKLAGESLAVAQKSWSKKEKPAVVDHLAYLATKRAAIAQNTASSRAAQAVVAGAGAERDKARLDLRTNEVAAVQQQLAVAQQSNAAKTGALAASDRELAIARQSNVQKTGELALADASAQQQRERTAQSDAKVSELEMQLKDLNAKKTDRGMVVTLGDVLFNSGKSVLLPGADRNMEKLAQIFKNNPDRMASIEGHTDSVGVASANYALSERRADSVMSALVKLGVSADRLSTRALGADMPVANNSTATGRQMNRRVEIVFTPQAGDLVAK